MIQPAPLQARRTLSSLAFLLVLLAAPVAAQAQPAFSKSFAPGTIGPGSASALTFTITAAETVTDLAFTDTLPAALTFADPPGVTVGAGCDPGTAVTAPAGGATLSFSSPRLSAGETCTVRVDVTGTTSGTHTNTSDALTSSAGDSGTATADLVISFFRPGFTKAFAPESVPVGDTTRLTFTIEYLGSGTASGLFFTDELPAGLAVAATPSLSNTCNGTVTADPGATTIVLSGGSVSSESTCEIGVDVVTAEPGTFANRTSELSSSVGGGGFAVDEVTAVLDPIGLTKRFADPVPPGATTDLVFTIRNRTRTTATDISFTDDLEATLSGLVATALPAEPCGAGSSITGTSVLTFAGGTLPSGESCTFSVEVAVPADAATGGHLNTTSTVSADLGFGEPSFFAPAEDVLDVAFAPVLTKELCDLGQVDPCVPVDRVDGGETITAAFTITNTDPANPVTELQFEDDFGAFLSGATVSPDSQSGVCGAGSAFLDLDGGSSGEVFGLVDGSLPAGGSCTFSVDVQLPDPIPTGTHVNRTTRVLGVIDDFQVTGTAGEAQVTSFGAPVLTKQFLDPVGPGDTVDLVFTLDAAESTEDFTDVSFTDDLDATLTGLVTVAVPPADPCGAGSTVTGGSVVELTGGTVPAGGSCSFTVTLQVPADAAPGSHLNTTSQVTATAGGQAVTGDSATDTLDVDFVTFGKSFVDDPAVPGGTVTLAFAIENLGPDPVSGLTFTDDLDAVLAGLAPTDTPQSDVCGIGSTLTFAGGVLELQGGSLPGGGNCVFQTVLQVPGGATPGERPNTTSTLSGNAGDTPFTQAPATDNLLVNAPLSLSKSFVDDPAEAGGTATLRFTLANTSPSQTATGLSFTDDLGAALPGLEATGLPMTGVCGMGSEIAGTDLLTFTGGSLGPGESCSFDVLLQVPDGVSGTFLNETSDLSATLGGEAVTVAGAADALVVTAARFSKAFSGDAAAGGTVTLTFIIENLSSTGLLANLGFTDDLDAVLPGLAAVGTPLADPCGAGSTLSGTSVLELSGASVPAGSTCTVPVTLAMPAGAAPGTFTNTSGPLTASGSEIAPGAVDDLTVVGGQPPSILEIPTLGQWGLFLLMGVLAALGLLRLRG